MTIRESLLTALRLLAKRDYPILALAVMLQLVLALADLVGIALIGLVLVLSTTYATGQTPAGVEQWVREFDVAVSPALIVWIVIAAATALISKSFLSAYLNVRMFRFLASRDASIASSLAEKLMAQPLVFIQRRSSQETAYALGQGVTSAVLGMLGSTFIAISETLLLVVLTLGLFVVDPLVAMYTTLFFFIVGFLLYRALSGWASRVGREGANLTVLSYQSIQEGLLAYREISVGNRRVFYVDRYKDIRSRSAKIQAHVQLLSLISKYVFEIALVVGGIALSITQFARQDLASAIAVIAVFLIAASRMMPSLLRIQNAAITIRQSASQAEPALHLAVDLQSSTLRPAESSSRAARALESGMATGYEGFDPSITLKSVSFAYPGTSTAAVIEVSFTIVSGQSVALVGPSGAGKSTLVDLMLGLLQPTSGSVTLGSQDPFEVLQRYPGAAAYMPQQVALFPESIRENVALGLPLASIEDDSVWAALSRAHIDEFVRGLPNGLDTRVGEHGFSLSGGQRQRLGLARALYSRPRLLVLDEATSALDAETEHAITESLADLQGTMTLVVIAHRLATVMHSDQVFFLDAGVLIASGTFDEVRKSVPQLEKQASLLGM